MGGCASRGQLGAAENRLNPLALIEEESREVMGVVGAAFPGCRTARHHLLLGLTLEAMRDFIDKHPRAPATHVCPGFCAELPEPERSAAGWTEGSDELPPMPDLVRAAHSASKEPQCAQCARLLRDNDGARGCTACGWFLCDNCVNAPATTGYEAREVIAAHAGPAGRSVAELLRADLGPTARGVGPATHFVSWHVGQRLVELFDALDK